MQFIVNSCVLVHFVAAVIHLKK